MRCMLHIVCCMLCAVCCILHVACRTPHVARMSYAACCMLRVACCVLQAGRCMLPDACSHVVLVYAACGALQLTHRGRFSGGMRHGPGVMSVGLKVSHQPKAASPQAHPMAHATPKVRMLSARTDAPTSPRTHSSIAPKCSATCEADCCNATHDVATQHTILQHCNLAAPAA